MSLLLLLPGFISLYLVLRGKADTAFLSVYLPCLLALPETYSVRLPHFPPTSAAQFALIPIGFVAISRLLSSGRFAIMDALILLYTASVGISEILHAPVLNDAIFSAWNAFVTITMAYMVGRKFIEPDLRFVTVRRFVVLMLLIGPAGLYEWRMGQNLYGTIGGRILGLNSANESVQMRGGHGRMGSAFSGAEIAGIAFAMTACINAWLVYLRKYKIPIDLGKTLTWMEKYHVAGLLLLSFLYLTQSRGPELAAIAGYMILQIPRFKNTKVMTAVVAVLFVVAAFAATAYFSAYTNVADPSMVTEQQGSALYRRNMNEGYAPIAELGGWTGWGLLQIPHLPGLLSIDNHFLLVHLAWGRLAYILFVLITWENIRVLVLRSWQFKSIPDKTFVFCLMAAMAVLWISLLTVYMGEQLPQVSFLLIGWVQALTPSKVSASPGAGVIEAPNHKFAFRRVFG